MSNEAAAQTVSQHVTQVGPFLVAAIALFGVLTGGAGRLISIAKVGLPKPTAVSLGYLVPELVLSFFIAGAHYSSTS